MPICIFCDTELTKDTKPEHILLNALGGRKTTQRVACSKHNGDFGETIDKTLAKQVEQIRNLLQLDSGTGKAPPMLRNLKSGNGAINLRNDGTPEIIAKPFEITQRPDGNYDLKILARSPEQLTQIVLHLAKNLGLTEEWVINLIKSSSGSIISKRPEPVHLPMSFGGPEAIRSLTKSCLELWALATSNEEVKSVPYDVARHFVLNGDDAFNKARVHIDSRYLPHSDMLKEKFGLLFNLIYIRSDDVGRVIGHFTLYNIISWHVILAESGGRRNTKIALVSNPLDPRQWSDTAANDFDIEFSWLNSPDYSDDFKRARECIIAMMEFWRGRAMADALGKIVNDAFDRMGVPDGIPQSNEEAFQQIIAEISDRAARLVLNLPHEQKLSPDDINKMIMQGQKRPQEG